MYCHNLLCWLQAACHAAYSRVIATRKAGDATGCISCGRLVRSCLQTLCCALQDTPQEHLRLAVQLYAIQDAVSPLEVLAGWPAAVVLPAQSVLACCA